MYDFEDSMRVNSEHISNDYLVLKYQKGNKDALKVLIRQFHPRLKEQIYIQTRDKASIDDWSKKVGMVSLKDLILWT